MALSSLPSRDVVNLQSPAASIESLALILFEEISAYELVNISRLDTIEGQNPLYTVISNLSSVRRNLDPGQIITFQTPNQTNFEQHYINLEEKIPSQTVLDFNNLSNFFYIANNGDLVIELDNLNTDEQIEVQIASSGKIT